MKAVYFFCNDLNKDPVSAGVYRCLVENVSLKETSKSVDDFPVMEYKDVSEDIFHFVRLNDVLSHDYPKYLPMLNENFSDYDFAGLVNWHEGSNAPAKVLTVHSTGDVPSGIFGKTNPVLFKNLIVAINRNRISYGLEDFLTSTEATHWSGMPYQHNSNLITKYDVPMYDVEIGSCKSSWQNEIAIKVLALSLLEVFKSSNGTEKVFTLLCIGGVHFEESFAAAILAEEYPLSIAHILPNQWLVSGRYDSENDEEEGNWGIDKFARAVDSALGSVDGVVFHDGVKSMFKQLAKIIAERNNIPVFKHKTLKDLSVVMQLLKKQ